MESGWFSNSSFSRSEGGTAVESERSYQISPIVLAPSPALLHGRGSTIPHGFGKECAWACSIVITLLYVWPREYFFACPTQSGKNACPNRKPAFGNAPFVFFGGVLDAVARVAGISI